MDLGDKVMKMKPAGMAAAEWAVRLELASLYRAFDWLGWTESIYNHLTLRVPGPEKHYLINPYGLNYNEVTATNLVKIDLDGETRDGSKHPVNKAGFVIHSAIHAARADAHCVIHTHSTAGMAVACKESGLRQDNFYSAILSGQVAYHDFEGISTDVAERPRLVRSLGDKSILILKSHGLLVVGGSVTEAYQTYWTLQRACEVQLAGDSMQGATIPIGKAVLDAIPAQAALFRSGPRPGGLAYDGLLRRAGIRYEDLV
jgi:ribulose-5-phosphate 4-epimerase/fuculose-1-phosphate aldolase